MRIINAMVLNYKRPRTVFFAKRSKLNFRALTTSALSRVGEGVIIASSNLFSSIMLNLSASIGKLSGISSADFQESD